MVSPLRRVPFVKRPECRPSQKEPKSLAPSVRPLAKARRSFAPVSIRGHCPPVGFAGTYMQRVRLRRTALRATPRMNTSTQPPDGAGRSRSRAKGELTLGLMSGEERRVYADSLWERACSRRRPDSRPASNRCTGSPCRSEPARDGCLTADLHLKDVLDPLWERACPRRRPDSQPILCRIPRVPGKHPTRFSGCPSEARSLAFVRR